MSQYDMYQINLENYISSDYIPYDIYSNSNINSTNRCITAKPKPLTIKKVIFDDLATIVLWSDKTKTVVKCELDDRYDKEKGLAMAISKKFLGNKGSYYEVFKKYIPEEDRGISEPYEDSTLEDILDEVLGRPLQGLKERMQNFYMED